MGRVHWSFSTTGWIDNLRRMSRSVPRLRSRVLTDVIPASSMRSWQAPSDRAEQKG